jgi:hypothetical protein
MPIVQIGETKQLEFGYGDIEVAPGLLKEESVGVVCFYNGQKGKPIGVKTNYKEPVEVPVEITPVRMVFEKIESIDVVIRALQDTKRLMLSRSCR